MYNYRLLPKLLNKNMINITGTQIYNMFCEKSTKIQVFVRCLILGKNIYIFNIDPNLN